MHFIDDIFLKKVSPNTKVYLEALSREVGATLHITLNQNHRPQEAQEPPNCRALCLVHMVEQDQHIHHQVPSLHFFFF